MEWLWKGVSRPCKCDIVQQGHERRWRDEHRLACLAVWDPYLAARPHNPATDHSEAGSLGEVTRAPPRTKASSHVSGVTGLPSGWASPWMTLGLSASPTNFRFVFLRREAVGSVTIFSGRWQGPPHGNCKAVSAAQRDRVSPKPSAPFPKEPAHSLSSETTRCAPTKCITRVT